MRDWSSPVDERFREVACRVGGTGEGLYGGDDVVLVDPVHRQRVAGVVEGQPEFVQQQRQAAQPLLDRRDHFLEVADPGEAVCTRTSGPMMSASTPSATARAASAASIRPISGAEGASSF